MPTIAGPRTNDEQNDRGPRSTTAISPAVDSFDRILVVTDGGRAGRMAVLTAVQLAAQCDAVVDALYVVDTTEHVDFVVERLEAAGEVAVEEAAERGAQSGVDVTEWFRYGRAHEEVLDFAAAHDVDLIVLGSPRRTGLDRLLHPEPLVPRVQRRAETPVLVVRTDG